eukprot:1161341-Pelagomonas_calceolata.AAC.4
MAAGYQRAVPTLTALLLRFQINAPLLLAASYSLFYTILDPLAGLSWAALVAYPLYTTALAFATVRIVMCVTRPNAIKAQRLSEVEKKGKSLSPCLSACVSTELQGQRLLCREKEGYNHIGMDVSTRVSYWLDARTQCFFLSPTMHVGSMLERRAASRLPQCKQTNDPLTHDPITLDVEVPNALAWAAGLHVFSWYMQVGGTSK